MVQIIEGQGSGIQSFLRGLLPGVTGTIDEAAKRYRQEKLLGKQEEQKSEKLRSSIKSMEDLGYIPRGTSNLAEDLYPELTKGGKTRIFEKLLNEQPEQQNIEQREQELVPEREQPYVPPKVEKTPEGKTIFPDLEPPDLTGKALTDYKKELRKENVPLFQDASSKYKALKNEKDHLKILNNLSPKVPDGLGRIFINPQGQIRPWAQILKLVPPEAERFVKTVNDFISGAKDIFGGRVTNFDIQTFQSRLPTLINSEKGRKDIIRQMDIFNEIESNYQKALTDVYKHYSLGEISQEKAQEIAESMVEDKEAELREELQKISGPEFNLEEMPEAAQHKGKIIEDDKGKRFKSNGTTWEPI